MTERLRNWLKTKAAALWSKINGSVVISLIAAGISFSSMWYARESNLRSEQMFGALVVPIVHEWPVSAFFDTTKNMLVMNVELTNITNFDAKGISIDAKFGDKLWISQWSQAKMNDISRKQVPSIEDQWILETWQKQALLGGQYTPTLGPAEADTQWVSGALDLDEICSSSGTVAQKESKVTIRTRWMNERRRRFDRISSYDLVCTRVDTGLSFTFILNHEEGPRDLR